MLGRYEYPIFHKRDLFLGASPFQFCGYYYVVYIEGRRGKAIAM
jgi:hypothetical protein